MVEGWSHRNLNEFVELKRGFDLPHHKRREGPFKVLSSGEAHGWHDEGPVLGPGFVIGRATNLGRPTWSNDDFWPLNTTLFVNNFLGNDPKFTYYWFENADLTAYNSGSVQPMLNRNYIAKVPVLVPPLSEQRAIAETLGALDDKIESNWRVQQLTEQLIRALVNRALRSATGGNALLADYCTLVKDQALVSELDSDSSYIGFEHMPKGSISLNDWGVQDGLASAKSRFLTGDVLFGKLRPYFKKVGIAPVDGVCSNDILVLRPNSESVRALVAVVASSDDLIDHVSAAATGTRMPRASWSDVSKWAVPKLSQTEIEVLGKLTTPLVNQLLGATHENRRLISLRDTLLPELLSGRIRVAEAADQVDSAL